MDKEQIRHLLIGKFSLGRLCRSVLLIVIAVYLGLFLYAYFFADKIAFQPPPPSYRNTSEIVKNSRRFTIDAGNGVTLAALYLNNPAAAYTILFSHGNAEDLGTSGPFLEAVRNAGFSVLAYDYRGYGTSNGMPGEENCYKDIETVYKFLTAQLKVAPERIIAHGRSLGGAFAIHLASQKPVAGLIIESSFTTGFRVLTQVPIFPLDRFRNIVKLKAVHCPTLFIHGRLDEVIPFSHGEKLLAAANEPKLFLWVDNAGHNDLFMVAHQRYLQKLQEFSESLENAKNPQ